MIWNMRYRKGVAGAQSVSASNDEIWDRLSRFLKDVVPVAEEAGVMLGAHPDDPPADALRVRRGSSTGPRSMTV